jgi:hypothetical protein
MCLEIRAKEFGWLRFETFSPGYFLPHQKLNPSKALVVKHMFHGVWFG